MDILEGRLKPGEWLRQERLAQELGVSHMPVREALKQLASQGLVEYVPYRGVRVVRLSAEDVEDLYECRAFMEGLAAAHAARHITAEQLEEMEGLHRRMNEIVGSVGIKEYRELNRRFHEIVIGASRRSYLLRTLVQLWSAFPSMLWSNIAATAFGSSPQREEADTVEHEAIIAALRSRDSEAARKITRQHIEAARDALLAALRQNEVESGTVSAHAGSKRGMPGPSGGAGQGSQNAPTKEER